MGLHPGNVGGCADCLDRSLTRRGLPPGRAAVRAVRPLAGGGAVALQGAERGEGVVAREGNRSVMFNPAYELLT